MKYEVRLTHSAEEDLKNIYSYIAYEIGSPEAAAAQLSRLEKNICELDEMTERFRLYEKEPWHSRGMRIMPVDNYLVFYITDTELNIVNIVRVMYGGRDIDAQLKRLSK